MGEDLLPVSKREQSVGGDRCKLMDGLSPSPASPHPAQPVRGHVDIPIYGGIIAAQIEAGVAMERMARFDHGSPC